MRASTLQGSRRPRACGAQRRRVTFHGFGRPPRADRPADDILTGEGLTEATATRIHIPSRTEVLDNGMRVIVHQDRSSPLVTVNLTYRAGSRDETPGRTGLAHLLEHLMFEGTEHAPKGHFDTLLEQVGGSNNGSTWLDRTNYYETVPTHAVEVPLWLERERMAFFLPVLTGEVLELQRGVVMNERRQVYENRPYGLAGERLNELLYPERHPYSWPTIGYMRDLEAITLDDARGFYGRFYTPGNAVLVFAGDVSPEEGFRLAHRYFGDLPAGPPLAETARPALPPAPGGRREVMDDDVTFPRVYHGWACPGFGSVDWVALDVLAYLLADGESSRLQRALVREGRLAQEVDTFLHPTALCAEFGIVATARSAVSPERLEAALRRELDRVSAETPEEAEVTGAVRRVRRDQVSQLATVEERAESLGYALSVLGEPEALNGVLDAYGEVTPDDVRRVATYLSAERAATVVVVPGRGRRARDA
jgi:zinc protease